MEGSRLVSLLPPITVLGAATPGAVFTFCGL
nr:MAG TPA: hypothetical protein [Caudoviricetes sp.]